jgi:hypothetical protein
MVAVAALHRGLSEIGYVDGRNLAVESRSPSITSFLGEWHGVGLC